MEKFLKVVKYGIPVLLLAVLAVFIVDPVSREEIKMINSQQLPQPRTEGRLSVEEAINRRESVRSFSDEALTLEDVSQLLWAAGGRRIDALSRHSMTYPSAGGINPLHIYLAAGDVEGLEAGVYKYKSAEHSLGKIKEGDPRASLARAAMGQDFIAQAPFTVVISGEPGKVTPRYGQRGQRRYIHMDAGHAGQNIYLTAVSRGLATVAVGAFTDSAVAEVMGIPSSEEPLYIYPLGRAAE